jgi:hypothetical protein
VSGARFCKLATLSIFLPGFSQPVSVKAAVGLEWILFCLNMLAGPDCPEKYAIGPEKHGLGPKNRKFASSLVGSGNSRGVARCCAVLAPDFPGQGGHFPARLRPQWLGPAAGAGNAGRTGHATAVSRFLNHDTQRSMDSRP